MYSMGLEVEFFTKEPLILLDEHIYLKSIIGYDGIGPIVKEIRTPPVYSESKEDCIIRSFILVNRYMKFCESNYNAEFVKEKIFEKIRFTAGIHISIGGDFIEQNNVLLRLFLIGILNESMPNLVSRAFKVGSFRFHKNRIEFRLLSSRSNLNKIMKTCLVIL
jgi:hypothetical protein